MSRKLPPIEPSAFQSRNEYIPSFISKKPFYVDDSTTDADYLEHQRLQSASQDTLDKAKWYDRGSKLGPAATKFRKGACENCGVMTHKTKDCIHRPRKQGAKFTGRDIQADEVVQDVKLGWDAKRDRWNGYDPGEYSSIVKEREQFEALQRAAMGEPKHTQLEDGEEGGTLGRPQFEEARYAEETDMGRNQPTSTRNLRLREDTAKYLLNLDLESAKYDPKTRSMVEMGDLHSKGDSASALIAEDNFMRASGDAAEFERAQKYAWETQERGLGKKLHLQANPTEGEVLRKKQTEEAESRKAIQRNALVEKYGGGEYLHLASVKDILENERYVEYNESGAVKGQIKSTPRSKYAEDVLTNNHTTVFGSWWSSFQWGYDCCHSVVRNSYCTGEEGKRAFQAAQKMRIGAVLLNDEDVQQPGRNESAAEKMRIGAVLVDDTESVNSGLGHEDVQQPQTNNEEPPESKKRKRRVYSEADDREFLRLMDSEANDRFTTMLAIAR
jgi:pre-mRNA-processing factor SLU7